LLKGNLCLAGALLKIAGLKAHAFARRIRHDLVSRFPRP
jgi:hypothetical protein